MEARPVNTIGAKWRQLVDGLHSKSRRDAFVAAHLTRGLAFQIREMREARGWTQKDLGARVGMAQETISQLENPGYGRFTTRTLLRLASAFDVAYMGRFVPFSELVRRVHDLSADDLAVSDYAHDAGLWVPLRMQTTGSSVHLPTYHPGDRPIPDVPPTWSWGWIGVPLTGTSEDRFKSSATVLALAGVHVGRV
jgi:transcriptional regulator with XRE-family HTH domain